VITHQLGIIGMAVILVASGAAAADEQFSDPPIVLVFRTSQVNGGNESTFDELISVSIAGDALYVILKRLAADYGYTFAYPPGDFVKRPGPHVYIEPTPARRAFERLAAAYGLCAIVDDQAMVGHPRFVRILPCESVERYRQAMRPTPKVELPKVRLGVLIRDGQAEGVSGTGAGGAVVEDLADEDPAYAAGIRVGDVIVSYGGEPVSGGLALRKLVGASLPGDAVPVVVVRRSRQLTVTVQFPLTPE
jgi:membrane-associated protease RseP (regulator of RpoE activity)